jgi:hypothetical protein
LNTKDMTAGSGKTRPVISVGNQKLKINNITFDQTPYDKDAYNILLHVEGKPVEGDFDGFLVDSKKSDGPRYKGQVGRVRFSPWPYKDAELPSGRSISRDTEVLKAMIYLSEVLDCRDELDMIEADDIFDFMKSVKEVMTGSGSSAYFNACIGGREWENKEGYVNNDLFLPRMSKNGIPIEALDKDSSRLVKFNKDEHIKPIKKKDDVSSFEPKENNNGSDFEL